MRYVSMVLFFIVFMRIGTIGADSDNEVHRLWGEDGVMNNADGIATDDHTHVSDALLGHRYIVPTIADHLLDDCNLIDQSGCHVITKELIQNLRKYLEIADEIAYIGPDVYYNQRGEPSFYAILEAMSKDLWVEGEIQTIIRKHKADFYSEAQMETRIRTATQDMVSEEQAEARIKTATLNMMTEEQAEARIQEAVANTVSDVDLSQRIEASMFHLMSEEEVDACDRGAARGAKSTRDCEWIRALWRIGRLADECEAEGGRWGMNDNKTVLGWECFGG